jgi:hypothetical protein
MAGSTASGVQRTGDVSQAAMIGDFAVSEQPHEQTPIAIRPTPFLFGSRIQDVVFDWRFP